MSDPRLAVRNLHDLVVLLPYLAGFHPSDSLLYVLIRDRRLVGLVRTNLTTDDVAARDAGIAAVREASALQQIPEVVLVGYGDEAPVAAAVAAATEALQTDSVDIMAQVRVADGRGYLLDGDGRPVSDFPLQPDHAPAVAGAVAQGLVAYSSRDAVAARVAAVTGTQRAAMDTADQAARSRLLDLYREVLGSEPAQPVSALAPILRERGTAAVHDARQRAGDGQVLADADVAWLVLLLRQADVRDDTLRGCDGSPAEVALWTDITRRADPSAALAPACLVAVNAYLAGDDMLVNTAIERALRIDPQHRLAQLLFDIQRRGIDRDVVRQLFARM
ncbi:DUF4192 domain-containing protein [Dactylosporangium sp. NPDC051541]|uniref:DUF4192 domain-containing protein n=1 Tax=Dactylosporangium sp. NPDC051541 TaxID=3363977 RepID=UPI0037A04A07